jgi:ADP-L-glycero-D-manno-heptose 6-epimerase
MSDQGTYIVTGGAGFIGSNLVAELMAVRPGCRIVVIDNFRSGSFANIIEACRRRRIGPFDGIVLPCSTAAIDWDVILDHYEPSVVFHLGAVTDTTFTDESEMIRENVAGFERLLCLASDARRRGRSMRVVYASSAAVYGNPPQGVAREAFSENVAGFPNNVYGFSKWLMENIHRAKMREDEGLPVVGLRYFNVFGPGESRKGRMASMVYQLASRMIRAERPRIFTDGEQARDQVPVEDVVECTLAGAGIHSAFHSALGDPATFVRPVRSPRPGIYNVGSGVATTFNEIVDALREGLGISASELPTEYFEMPARVRAFYQTWTRADMRETADGLGFTPRRRPREAIIAYARHLAGHLEEIRA